MKSWITKALLALFMAVATAALTAHTTVHVDDGVEQCLLCASHADSPTAACGQPQWPASPEPGVPLPQLPSTDSTPAAGCPAPLPRAPPAIS